MQRGTMTWHASFAPCIWSQALGGSEVVPDHRRLEWIFWPPLRKQLWAWHPRTEMMRLLRQPLNGRACCSMSACSSAILQWACAFSGRFCWLDCGVLAWAGCRLHLARQCDFAFSLSLAGNDMIEDPVCCTTMEGSISWSLGSSTGWPP